MPLRTVAQQRWLDSEDAGRMAGVDRARAYGVLSSIRKDDVYWFGRRGLLFTSPWVVTPDTVRHAAVLLLTASGEPVELTVGDRVVKHRAAAIAPLTRRGLRAVDVGLVSVNIEPHHPLYGAFRHIPRPGVLGLDRQAFGHFDGALVRAYEGRLTHREAERLFEDLVRTAAGRLPGPARRDERAELLLEFLRQNPACSLGEIARELNLSYTGASHLFSRTIGLPLRSYQTWMKCAKAAEQFQVPIKLTDIARAAGFTDLAHMVRTWQRNFAMSPTYVRDPEHVRIFI